MSNISILQQARSLGLFFLESYLLARTFLSKIAALLTREKDIFIPEVSALLPDKKSYFDIALAGECTRKMIARWKLLESLSREKGGRLFLFIPQDNEGLFRRLIENNRIEAVVVPFDIPQAVTHQAVCMPNG